MSLNGNHKFRMQKKMRGKHGKPKNEPETVYSSQHRRHGTLDSTSLNHACTHKTANKKAQIRDLFHQNSMRAGLLFIAICTIFIAPQHLGAQSQSYFIPKLNGPITLDGRVDEPAWQAIEPLPLVTHWPSFGDPVLSSQTKLRIAHDEEYLYVSCVCYETPENVVAATYKRDEINHSISNVSIILDTFHDSENALWFAVTPTGSRTDAAIGNDGASINVAWNTIWEAETVITDFGWTAEMRIPFSSLRFESRDGRVKMGLIASRYKAHSTTLHIFPAIPPDWGFNSWSKVSQAAGIVLHDVDNRMPVFITPYLLAGGERAAARTPGGDGFSHDSDLALEAGLDVKMGITNNTTLDLTFNTDFAQVEADYQQVNLSRFSLFFPEQRQFFLERASVFNFSFGGSDRLFHSRRIGLHEGQQVRILGGARSITRSRGWDLGLLSMQTARDHGLQSKNHSVVRVRKRLFNPQSYGGGLVTSRIDESGNYDVSVGLDGIFNIRGDDFLDINLAQTISSDVNATLADTEFLRFRGVWERRRFEGLSYAFSFNYSGERYEPAMGFQLRNNYKQIGDRVSWGWIPDESSLRNIRVSMIGTAYLRNSDGSLETSRFGPSVELTWRRDDFFYAELLVVTEDLLLPFQLSDDAVVPAGNYRFPEAFASYHTPRGRPLRVVFSAGGGGFFDGERFTGSISNTWDPSRVVNLNLFYQYNSIRFWDRNQSFDAHIARFRTEFTFNTRMTLSSFIQYNSAGEIGILNARLRYNPRDGNNFYIVFNETVNTDRDRLTPRLPLSDHRTVLLKFDYTF